MARPPLVLGTWGSVSRSRDGALWTAKARFRDYDGITRLVARSGPTGRQAENALLAALRERTRVPGADMTGDTRVSDLATAWLVEFEGQGRAPQTLERYRQVLRRHVLPGVGGLLLREASVPAVDRFLGAVRRTAGPQPAKLARVVLMQMFALAVRHGAVPSNPARDTAPVRIERGEVKTITLERVLLLREQLGEWDRGRDRAGNLRVTDLADPVDMFLATGARTGEVLGLRWRDIVLGADPTVEVRGTVVHTKGAGLVVQDRPKSDTSRRSLHLPPFAVEMLARRRRAEHGEFVFPSSVGTLRSPANFRRQWRSFREHFGYEDWVTPKTFRKTVATLIRDEADIELASRQLGHADRRITEQHYAERLHSAPDLTEVLQQFAG